MNVRNIYVLSTAVFLTLSTSCHEIAKFRLPTEPELFLTEEKESLLKNYLYLMPQNTATEIASSPTAWEKYKDQGATAADYNHALTMKKILETLTISKAIYNLKKAGTLDIYKDCAIEWNRKNATTSNFWNFYRISDDQKYLQYWIVYEKDNLSTHEQKNELYDKNKKNEDYKLKQMRTKDAILGTSIENAVKFIQKYNQSYSYANNIDKNNFNTELRKLEENTQKALPQAHRDDKQEHLSISHDRILYDMLAQLGKVEQVDEYGRLLTKKMTPDNTSIEKTKSTNDTSTASTIEIALKMLSTSLQNLADQLTNS